MAGLPGVEAANLNFGASTLTVIGNVDHQKIMKEVAKEGANAKPVGRNQEDVKETFYATYSPILMPALSGLALLIGWFLETAGTSSSITIPVFLLSIIVGGYKSARSALYGLRKLNFDMNVLMTFAIIGAMFLGQWTEAAMVAFLFSVSLVLSSYTMEKARDSIRSLMELAPREATVERDLMELKIPVEEVVVGDIMIVRPGEKIAMDGIVLRGTSSVNEASITGESMPVEKKQGDDVFAGTLNQQGSIEVRVTKLAEDTTLQKIIYLVQEAQGQKARSEAFVDKFSKIYTPAVIVFAVLIAALPPLLFGDEWQAWFYRGLALLVVACPCALIISTPVSIVAAIGNAARKGVLIKGGVFIEDIGKISVVAFDKTGTLTVGRPEVTDLVAFQGLRKEQVLEIAASIEKYSEHPLADAIVREAKKRHLDIQPVHDFNSVTGRGVVGAINETTYRIGNQQFHEDLLDQMTLAEVLRLQQEGKTVMILATDEQILGIVAVADQIRDCSHQAIEQLRKVGVKKTVMLTGDNEVTARAIAQMAGIDEYRAELLPQDKLEMVKTLQKQYGKVAMIGDGINDAPALAIADLGIAMGVSGTDTALETADVALMSDDLTKLPFSISLSKATMRVIKQNIYFSLIIKAIALLAVFPGWLTLFLAILSDVGAALLVTLNGLRLLRMNPENRDPK